MIIYLYWILWSFYFFNNSCNFRPCLITQIINVYHQQYESVAAFWPQVHSRIIASLLISQLLLMGLLSTKKAANSTPLLVVLPILTLSFHKYCKNRFEPAFRKYPLEVSSKLCQQLTAKNFLYSYMSFSNIFKLNSSTDKMKLTVLLLETCH